MSGRKPCGPLGHGQTCADPLQDQRQRCRQQHHTKPSAPVGPRYSYEHLLAPNARKAGATVRAPQFSSTARVLLIPAPRRGRDGALCSAAAKRRPRARRQRGSRAATERRGPPPRQVAARHSTPRTRRGARRGQRGLQRPGRGLGEGRQTLQRDGREKAEPGLASPAIKQAQPVRSVLPNRLSYPKARKWYAADFWIRQSGGDQRAQRFGARL